MTSPGLLVPIVHRVTMMITAKNDAMMTATVAMMIGQKIRGPGNFINADQTF
jgi:hypothetical protein